LCASEARETYRHFFVDCPFVQNVWANYATALHDVGFVRPTSLHDFLVVTPPLRRRWQRIGVELVWPILRGCLWFTLWKCRNDVVFCPTGTFRQATAQMAASKAAFVIKIHLQHLLLSEPDNQSLVRLLLTLHKNDWAQAHLVPLSLIQAITLVQIQY
jgi:hypothetical protein